MQNGLFTEPREEFVLWSEKDRRILLRQNMHPSDAEISNDWYEDSLCGHLKWQRAAELKVRNYTVKP